MSKEMQTLFIKKEDENQEEDLENLIEKYIKQSEELEIRENKILQQVELIQSAVTSLQAWRETRKSSMAHSEFLVPLDLKQIEEETKKIREETRRIQLEIEQKMAENKVLEEEIERRKTLENENEVQSTFEKLMEDYSRVDRLEKEEIESRRSENENESESVSEPLSFKEKLIKLEEIEKKLKDELRLGSEEFRKRNKTQSDKITLLEWESNIHKEFIENLKKQNK